MSCSVSVLLSRHGHKVQDIEKRPPAVKADPFRTNADGQFEAPQTLQKWTIPSLTTNS